jgi:chorismate lyase / 3-hydroxybenzoate synthase
MMPLATSPLAVASDGVPAMPAWAHRLVSEGVASGAEAQVDGVEALSAADLEQAVAAAFRDLLDQLAAQAVVPVRFWAFIPRIHTDHGDGLDRYHVFNAGRFAAFSAWMESGQTPCIPTASAVGVDSGALRLFGIGTPNAGVAVENPRQVPAYRYSRRYGPRPPCFARATRLRDAPLLLVGGTASITGEESVHLGEIAQQTDETLRNLASVVCAGWGGSDPDSGSWLGAFRELRVYHPIPAHRSWILDTIKRAFPGLRLLEAMTAELCRRELLVEIEGVAENPASTKG